MKPSYRTVLAALALAAAVPAYADDAAFFAAYDQVNSNDIAIAELGAVKGSSEDVRAVAAMVLRDHSAVREMGRDLAEDLGITYQVPTDNAAAQAHSAAFERLNALSGLAFDQAYLAHEAQFHTAAIEAVKTVLIPQIEADPFRAHLEAVLPAFEHHLMATLEAARTLGYDVN